MSEEDLANRRVHNVGHFDLEPVGTAVRFLQGGRLEEMYRTLSAETEMIEVTSHQVLELPTGSGVPVKHHGILHFRGSPDHSSEYAAPFYVASGMTSSGLSKVTGNLFAENGLIALQEVSSDRIEAQKVWIESLRLRGEASAVKASIVAIGRLTGGAPSAWIEGSKGIYLGIVGGVDAAFRGRRRTDFMRRDGGRSR
jgi:hypothetical protein